MPTTVASPHSSAAPWRPSWRALALLVLLVALAHMALLGLAPAGLGAEPLCPSNVTV